MLELEPIKERLAWVDEEGLNGYTWDIRNTYREYCDLVAEVERLRAGLQEIIGEPWLMGGQDACTIASDGLTWSLDLYLQFNARVRRQGQGRPVMCHRIMTTKTLDQAQAMALSDKDGTQADLRRAVKQYRLEKGV
jgi:hypothetical protein